MDYFGVMDDLPIDSINETNPVCFGFPCKTKNCRNIQAIYGEKYLPYCDQTCIEKNIYFLLVENAQLKGENTAYHLVISSNKK